ncbi:hypothetical protein [Methylobacterium sp. CM6244]
MTKQDAITDRFKTKTEASKIFAIDRRLWGLACDLGLNAAVAYLVLACGSGADNRTTSWSAKSIEEYTGIGRIRAPRAIEALKDAGLLTQIKGGTRPRYLLQAANAVPGSKAFWANPDAPTLDDFKPEWIWLSNRLVTGFDDEDVSLLEAIRKTQNLAALRLLVNLYADSTFTKEGGLEWREGGIRQAYERRAIGKTEQVIVWGFRPRRGITCDPVGFPFRYGESFEADFGVLRDLDAVALVPHLVEGVGYDIEVLHSLADRWHGVHHEAEILEEAMLSARRLLPPEAIEKAAGEGFTLLVPTRRTMPDVQVVGIARLACLPRARLAVEWMEKNSGDWSFAASEYASLGPATSRSTSRSTSTSSSRPCSR